MDMNNVSLIGRLTKDPELKFTPSGKAVCSFSIANNKMKEGVNFFNIVTWGKTAEYVSSYVKKGNRVAIEGRLEQRSWESEQGKRSTVEIVAERIQGLEKKSDNESQPVQQNLPDEDVPF